MATLRTMNENPCKCKPPERTPTCHSTCEKYLEWKAKLEADKELFNEKTQASRLYNQNRRDRIEAMRRRNRNKK